MSRIILFLMMLCCLTVTACGDAVKADLEAFDKAGREAFQGLDMAGLNRKVAAAKTNTDKSAIMASLAKEMQERSKNLNAYKAKTPEVKQISEKMASGFSKAIEGTKEAEQAFAKENAAMLSSANAKIQAGQSMLQQAAKDFSKLAKEKGYKTVK